MKKRMIAVLLMAMVFTVSGCGENQADIKNEGAEAENAEAADEEVIAQSSNEAEESSEAADSASSNETKEAGCPESGVYQALYEEELEGEMTQSFHYIIVSEDMTGLMIVQDEVNITINEDAIKDEGGTEYKYSYDSENKAITLENGEKYSYINGTNAEEFIENHDNPEYMFGIECWIAPSDFVEEAAGKTRFESYDELISYLKPGQGYAYVKLFGSDEDLLFITDEPYDNGDGKMVAITADIHGFRNGAVEYYTVEQSLGTANPLAVADGVLYSGGHHEVNGDFVVPDGDAIMMKFTASEENGEYTGFFRTTNSFEESVSTEITTKEQYDELYDQFLAAEPIEFTIVK